MKTILERDDEKMKRKNGFTLIELLAVIVILAIIALIAVPVVMNIINRANKSAFKDSAYGLIKAGELFYTDQLLENAGLTEDKTFNFPDDIEGLEFKGSKPTDGFMTVNKDGKVSMAITNGKYCVTKGFEDDDVIITDDAINCELGPKVNTLSDLARTYTFTKVDGSAYETPTVTVPECITDKTKCEAGTPVAVEVTPNTVYKFYVLNDDITKNEVTLIMNRNLYSDTDENNGNVAWVSLDDYKLAGGSETEYGEYGNNNKGPLTALRVLKERTSGWINIPAYTYTLSLETEKGLVPATSSTTEITGELVTDVRARLPKWSDFIDFGTTKNEYGAPSDLQNWLYENLEYTEDGSSGYWTGTAWSDNDYGAWSVDFRSNRSGMYYLDGGSTNGLRPVITLSK